MNDKEILARICALRTIKQGMDSGRGVFDKQAWAWGKNMASRAGNAALQSPVGQGALNLGAGAYNKLPQTARNWVGGKAMQYGGVGAQNNYQLPGFKADPSKGTHVNAETTVTNDKLTDDRVTTHQPGFAGSPLSQLGRGMMGGKMPQRTFPRGAQVSNRVDVRNDQLTGDALVPRRAQR